MPRYRLIERRARWETWTFYTEADSKETARAKFDTGDIEGAADYVLGGYLDSVAPECIVEPVSAPVQPRDHSLTFSPSTKLAIRLIDMIRTRHAGEHTSIQDWISAAREIGPVVTERYKDAHGERLCKLTFDDGSEVELVEPVDKTSWIKQRISWVIGSR